MPEIPPHRSIAPNGSQIHQRVPARDAVATLVARNAEGWPRQERCARPYVRLPIGHEAFDPNENGRHGQRVINISALLGIPGEVSSLSSAGLSQVAGTMLDDARSP